MNRTFNISCSLVMLKDNVKWMINDSKINADETKLTLMIRRTINEIIKDEELGETKVSKVIEDVIIFNPLYMDIRISNWSIDPFKSALFNTWNITLPLIYYRK